MQSITPCCNHFFSHAWHATNICIFKPCLQFVKLIFEIIGACFFEFRQITEKQRYLGADRANWRVNDPDWIIEKHNAENATNPNSNQSFHSLSYTGSNLRTSYDFWKGVLMKNTEAIQAIPSSVFTEEFVIKLITDYRLFDEKSLNYDRHNFGFQPILRKIPNHFFDKETVILALAETRKYDLLNFMSKRLRSDKEFAKKVVSVHPFAIKCFSYKIRDDDEIIALASSKSQWSLLFASQKHRDRFLSRFPQPSSRQNPAFDQPARNFAFDRTDQNLAFNQPARNNVLTRLPEIQKIESRLLLSLFFLLA